MGSARNHQDCADSDIFLGFLLGDLVLFLPFALETAGTVTTSQGVVWKKEGTQVSTYLLPYAVQGNVASRLPGPSLEPNIDIKLT